MKTNAEATVVLKFNQGTKKGTGCYRSFLCFGYFLLRKKK